MNAVVLGLLCCAPSVIRHACGISLFIGRDDDRIIVQADMRLKWLLWRDTPRVTSAPAEMFSAVIMLVVTLS